MASCTVLYRDASGVEHAVNVTADSLFEALASSDIAESRRSPRSHLLTNYCVSLMRAAEVDRPG